MVERLGLVFDYDNLDGLAQGHKRILAEASLPEEVLEAV